MPKMIFVNLPVVDPAASTAFHEPIGFTKNDAFSNEQPSAMGWSDAISVMLLGHDFYPTFTDKPIIDTGKQSAVLLCLSFDSRAKVDAIHQQARKAGGRQPRAIEDQGFMYGGAFEDPDGHTWETVWMDQAAVAQEAWR